ncbi:unnamed protein product, partial [Candidula unifasciata]
MSSDGETIDSVERNKLETNHQDSCISSSLLQKEVLNSRVFTASDNSPSSMDHTSEISKLQLSNKQLKLDLQAEQDAGVQLRKKFNAVEKQKLEIIARTNEEIGSLESQLAKAHLQVEKVEATRRNLEYELTKSQQEIHRIRETSKHKEDILLEGTEDLKNKLEDLSEEIKQLHKSLQTCKISSQEKEEKLKQHLEDKTEQILKYRAELEVVCTERDKLNEVCQQHLRVISDLNNRLQGFEDEKRNVLDSLRQATNELKYAKDREERLKCDLEVAQSRIKTLEDSVENERASHLETKFTSEIVHLRVRDLEGATEVGKSTNMEANKAIERLTQQNRELEQVYEEERKNRKELSKQLDKIEKEHMTVRKQLSIEIDDKKAVIDSLSKELETHQKNFNDLKSELNKTKKRQQQLEEIYNGSIKELELLPQTFHFDDKKSRMSRKEDGSETNKGKKIINPTAVVENFKHVFAQLKRKLDSQTEELFKTKKTVERLTKDLDASKELIKTKDKTIEETQKAHTKTIKDLNKARSNCVELEATIGKLKTNLQHSADNQEKDRIRIQELSEEIMKLVKRYCVEEEVRITFLHELHQKLLSCHVNIPNKDRVINDISWADLAEVIYEQVSLVVESLQDTQQKLQASYNLSREKQNSVTSLKQKHAEQITKLTNTLKEKEATWQQQRKDMEQHYTKMLSDMQLLSKKTQAIADETWEKLRATGNLQLGLETEVVELRHSLAESQVHVSSLLSACALLSGAVYPLYTRVLMLASERHILEDIYTTWESCRERALYLSSVLRSGKDSDQDRPERDSKLHRKIRPVLRFRVGVIVVLAANRLLNLAHTSARCFLSSTSSSASISLSVNVGGFYPGARTFTVDQCDSFSSSADAQKNLRSWLESPALLQAVVKSMVELQECLHEEKDSLNQRNTMVVSAARSSFNRFLDHLSQFFPFPAHSPQYSFRDGSSLVNKLEKRLSQTLSKTNVQLKGNLVSSQDLMCNLQNHILDLTQRLHTAEKERRHLLTELNMLKEQIGETSLSPGDTESMSRKVQTKYVPMSKFEQVCLELSNSLSREQKAQELLQEQNSQLLELTSRLDHCASDGMHKQTNLVQIQEHLTETQKELKHKEQFIRQYNQQLGQVQHERDSLHSNLEDAENTLRIIQRDKDMLVMYVKHVESALEVTRRRFVMLHEPWTGSDVSLTQLLLDADLIPQDLIMQGLSWQPNDIFLFSQNLVHSFVEIQHQAVKKITSLHEEIVCYRDHIETLKREINNAVHRAFIDQVVDASGETVTSLLDLDLSEREVIVAPSEEQTNGCAAEVSLKSPVTSPVYQSENSAFHPV